MSRLLEISRLRVRADFQFAVVTLWRLDCSQLQSEVHAERGTSSCRAQKMPFYEFENTREGLLTADFSHLQLLIRFHARRLPGQAPSLTVLNFGTTTATPSRR